MTDLDIKQDAFELRKKFNLSETEPIRLKSLLLKQGILTYFAPLDDDFSGMTILLNEKKFVLINSNHSIGRQHFTICHELYHLYVDKKFHPHRCQTSMFDKNNKSEYWADIFASHFLLPEQGILSEIPKLERRKNKITLATIIKIEQYYSCSRSALLHRLFALKMISWDYRDELIINVRKSAQEYGYSIGLYNSGNEDEFWGDYGTKAKQLFHKDIISEGHYVSLMKDIGIDVFKTFENNGD